MRELPGQAGQVAEVLVDGKIQVSFILVKKVNILGVSTGF